MKIKDLIQIESEQIELLRDRSQRGDNHATQVLLEHLRYVSKNIEEWKRNKDITEANQQ